MLPAHIFLNQNGIPYSIASFSPSTPKGASSVAVTLGLKVHQTIKTLIFQTEQGEQMLVMVGGDQSVISSHLKKVAGSRNVQLASPDTVIQTTGYKIGSIPPFFLATKWIPFFFGCRYDE
jgi:Cys-tRNA(Pro)/Cys-tRNA(Cys) deacylase